MRTSVAGDPVALRRPCAPGRVLGQADQCLGCGLGVTDREDQAVVSHRLGVGASIGGHHRHPMGHGLDHRQPERFGGAVARTTDVSSSSLSVSATWPTKSMLSVTPSSWARLLSSTLSGPRLRPPPGASRRRRAHWPPRPGYRSPGSSRRSSAAASGPSGSPGWPEAGPEPRCRAAPSGPLTLSATNWLMAMSRARERVVMLVNIRATVPLPRSSAKCRVATMGERWSGRASQAAALRCGHVGVDHIDSAMVGQHPGGLGHRGGRAILDPAAQLRSHPIGVPADHHHAVAPSGQARWRPGTCSAPPRRRRHSGPPGPPRVVAATRPPAVPTDRRSRSRSGRCARLPSGSSRQMKGAARGSFRVASAVPP